MQNQENIIFVREYNTKTSPTPDVNHFGEAYPTIEKKVLKNATNYTYLITSGKRLRNKA